MPYFHIMTCADVHPGQTLFRTNEGHTVATIEWRAKDGGPYVEVYKTIARQPVSAWLSVSGDASYRIMDVYGKKYVWVPQNHSICMYQWSPGSSTAPHLLARIEKDAEDNTVRLDITLEAVNHGLLEVAVVAATLFQSGYSID
ncbi:hypothetical protein DFH09DRAFT_1150146 [Mycena vulgaris]|nr:hypothetical protein DFH09DRAFT_1150146 [Mycena vulgaris]